MEETKTKIIQTSDDKDQSASDFSIHPVSEIKSWYSNLLEFGKEVLKPDTDFGIISGSEKPVLLKPGAEKIKNAFGLQVEKMECIMETCDLQNNFVDYTYKCIIISKSGKRLGICDGNANSKEEKFKYIFKPSEKIPVRKELVKMKIEGKGKWKKCFDKWIWFERYENPNVISLKNSIQKVAQKRAFVGAVLMATGASEFFTQDITVN